MGRDQIAQDAAVEQQRILQTQLDDLETSRRELRTVISALDEEIGRLFREAFDDIAAAFEEGFNVLFPGGRGRLRSPWPAGASPWRCPG